MKRRGLTAVLLSILLLWIIQSASASTVYVCIEEDTYLNGRERPSRKAFVSMRLYNGDELEAISFDGEWVEVIGGESGTSFIKAQYLSEIIEPVYYRNVSEGRVRVRKTPDNDKAIAWIRVGEKIKVTRQIFGWGYCRGGWVDLSFFEKEK